MQRRWRQYWLACTVAALSTALIVVVLWNIGYHAAAAQAMPTVAPPASDALLAAAQGLDTYQIDAVFDPERATLRCLQTVVYQNRTPDMLDDIYFHTYANAFKREETTPAGTEELYASTYGVRGFSPGWMEMESLRVEGTEAAYAYLGDAEAALRVPVQSLAPGDTVRIEMTYILHIPACAYRFGVAQEVWSFGNAFPIAAMYEQGAWRLDAYGSIGDPFYSACANYTVDVRMPKEYQAATTGVQTRQMDAGMARIHVDAPASRSFAMVLSKEFDVSSCMTGDTLVTSYALTRGGGQRALEAAAQALSMFEDAFGAYPYPTLAIASVDLPLAGMEYPGLVMIYQTYYGTQFANELASTVAHEVAHQWFYALVGNDEVKAPWLDEALASYAALLYTQRYQAPDYLAHLLKDQLEASMRVTVPGGATVGSDLDAFGSMNAYATVVYHRGSAMMWGLDEAIGREEMYKALQHYIARNAFGMATRADFERALYESTRYDWSGYLADYLDISLNP